MTSLLRLAGVAFVLSGAVAQAKDVDPVALDKLVAVITEHGCKVTDSNNEAILSKAGLAPEAAKTLVDKLLSTKRAEVMDGKLVLKTEGCN